MVSVQCEFSFGKYSSIFSDLPSTNILYIVIVSKSLPLLETHVPKLDVVKDKI